MRVLIQNTPDGPPVDYTSYVVDGSLTVEDSINVPTLISFQLVNKDNAFVPPKRSSYVTMASDIYTSFYEQPTFDYITKSIGPSLNIGGNGGAIEWNLINQNTGVPTGGNQPWPHGAAVYFQVGGYCTLYVPAAGNYNFNVQHLDGSIFAIEGASIVSGPPNNNPGGQTVTPLLGLSFTSGGVAAANNTNGSYPGFNDNYVINFPAAGSYLMEFGWCSQNAIAEVGLIIFTTGPSGTWNVTQWAGSGSSGYVYILGDVTGYVLENNPPNGTYTITLEGEPSLVQGRTLATGFVTNEPERDYLGLSNRVPGFNNQMYTYNINVTSDEWLLNSQAVPYIPAFVNQTDSQILAAIAEALMPGFFDTTTFMAPGVLIPYFQYDPSQTWSDIAKTFADANRYHYKVINKQILYQPFGDVPLGIAYDDQNMTEGQLAPIDLKTGVLTVPPVNDCIVIGDVEPQTNYVLYTVGDGFTSNFQLTYQMFQGTSANLLEDDWTEGQFTQGTWIVSDPDNVCVLADSDGNAIGALNIVQKGQNGTYGPEGIGTYIQAQNGLELGGGLNLQHGSCTFNDTASGGGGIIGGVYGTSVFNPGTCLAGFGISGQPNIGQFTVVSVQILQGDTTLVNLTIDGTAPSNISPGNVFECASFVNATFLNGKTQSVVSVTQISDTQYVITGQSEFVYNNPYGPTADSGTITFGSNAVLVTASGAAGIVIQPIFSGAYVGTPVVTQVNHQYTLQTWIGAEAPNRYTRPYTNLTQTATYGNQDLAASGSITFVITDVDLGNYVIEEQNPLFGLFPAAPPPVVTKYTATNVDLPPFALYCVINGIDLNVSLNYTILSLPPQGYLTVQSLTGASGGNLPWLPDELSIPIVYQLGFGQDNQTAQISQQGEAYALSFYTDDIPSVGARIVFQSWSAGQSCARVIDPIAIAQEAAISGDSGVRSAIMQNLSPLPRTSDECEAAAAAAILDAEYPQFQGTYTITTIPYKWLNMLSPSLYGYPMTGRFLYINSPVRGITGQNMVANTVRYQVLELRQEIMTVSIDYGMDLYLEKLLPSFLEREQNLLVPTQTVAPPNPITLPQVLNAYLPTVDGAVVTNIVNSLSGNYIIVDCGAPPVSGYEVRTVDSGFGTTAAGRVGVFTTQIFTLPRTARDQTWYIRSLNGSIFSRFSKAIRVAYPLIPSAPTLVNLNATTIVFDYAGDVRDIYGIELRVPAISGIGFIDFANAPEDIVSAFYREALDGSPYPGTGNSFAYYGTMANTAPPWTKYTPYQPGYNVRGTALNGSQYIFQLQPTPVPFIAQQNDSPIENMQAGNYVAIYYFQTSGNPGIFQPYPANPTSAVAQARVNSLAFNAGTSAADPDVTMTNFVLNQSGLVTTTIIPWGGATQSYSMAAIMTIEVPAAGDYTMVVNHDDGFFFGINGVGTVTLVSGPNTDTETTTALNGYTTIGGYNQNFTPRDQLTDTFVIHFSAAGKYNVEFDYFNWEDNQTFTVQFGQGSSPSAVYAPIPVNSGGVPLSMGVEPVWTSVLNSTVVESVTGYNGPFGMFGPLGGALEWKNTGPVTNAGPPPYQVQIGDVVYLSCPEDSSFQGLRLATGVSSSGDNWFSWFDYGYRYPDTVGTVGTQGTVGVVQLVLSGDSWNTVSGNVSYVGGQAIATLYTSEAHDMLVGELAIVSCGFVADTWPYGSYGPLPPQGAFFCGNWRITSVPASNQIQFVIGNYPYVTSFPLVQLSGLVAAISETEIGQGGVIVQKPVFAPSDLVIDLTQPDIADELEIIQATAPNGQITGLTAYFFNLTWDYSYPTVVPVFSVPSLTGLIIDTDTQQILWGVGSGAPDGYRVEIVDSTTGLIRNAFTLNHPSNPQLVKQFQMSVPDYSVACVINVTPFNAVFGDGPTSTIIWSGGSGGGGGGGGNLSIGVTAPLTEENPAPGLIILGVNDFVGDTGTGGRDGTVPAPPAGSAANQEFLSASGSWAELPNQPYNVIFSVPGQPPAGMIFPIEAFPVIVSFLANWAGSIGFTMTNPSGTATYTVYKISGVTTTQVGTVTISTGGIFTFATTGGAVVTFNVGDFMYIVAPNPQDSTLSNVSMTFQGSRAN